MLWNIRYEVNLLGENNAMSDTLTAINFIKSKNNIINNFVYSEVAYVSCAPWNID